MTCPVCAQPTAPDYRPFCSRRCADVDLGRWLTESYRIPAKDDEAEDTAEHTPDSPRGSGPH